MNKVELNSTKTLGNEHNVTMQDRKYLEITGVKQVDSFDSEEFLLDTVMGFLAIKGQNLQMAELLLKEMNLFQEEKDQSLNLKLLFQKLHKLMKNLRLKQKVFTQLQNQDLFNNLMLKTVLIVCLIH